MKWGVCQEYVTGRAQGFPCGGHAKSHGMENRLYNRLYKSFGQANRVS